MLQFLGNALFYPFMAFWLLLPLALIYSAVKYGPAANSAWVIERDRKRALAASQPPPSIKFREVYTKPEDGSEVSSTPLASVGAFVILGFLLMLALSFI